MADEATQGAAEAGPAAPFAVSTADPVQTETKAEERHGQVDVRDLEAEAAEAGDPYFGDYAADPDDNRADEGTREPRPSDPGTAKLLGVEK